MRKCVLCAAAAACLSAANAETVLFPNADGSGDLSSAAAWNNAMPPMTTDTIVQVLPSGATYIVSRA